MTKRPRPATKNLDGNRSKQAKRAPVKSAGDSQPTPKLAKRRVPMIASLILLVGWAAFLILLAVTQ